MPKALPLITDLSSFFSRVKVGDVDDCWPWALTKRSDGYARVRYRGRQRSAHGVAYELANGEVNPVPRLWRHTCNNPPCCNPRHVLPGDDALNARDRVESGRSLATRGPRRGGRALTREEREGIAARFLGGERASVLGLEFGISEHYVRMLARRVRGLNRLGGCRQRAQGWEYARAVTKRFEAAASDPASRSETD